jgi:GH43 family beta-xylosidase
VGLATVVVLLVVTATVALIATVGRAPAAPHHSHGRTVLSPIPVVDRPPSDPHPAAPGTIVPSGQDQSDPVLYRMAGRYFLFTSGIPGSDPINVPVASTTGFSSWGPVTDALPVLPGWATPGYTWAPDLHRFGATFRLYFTALLRGSTPAMECIGDATGAAPDGPFHAAAQPFICQTRLGGSIDPRVFTNAQGTWMLWKSDQNIGGATTPTTMWSQPLSADGLLTGTPHALMSPDEAWQGTIVEAPDMVEVGGRYWLFYSGNWFNQDAYAVGVARCAGPTGPCADTSARPLLASNAQGAGPGEASVFSGPDGVWMLYSSSHSSIPLPQIPPRPVVITRIGFTRAGPYLAAGGTPPSLEALGSPLWPG